MNQKVKRKIGQHFFIGFHGKTMKPSLDAFLREWLPGGVIHFTRNIGTEEELKVLNRSIINIYHEEGAQFSPFIGVDMEGGRVARLKPPYRQFPSATDLAEKGEKAVYSSTKEMAAYLKAFGFNLDFLPLLDVLTSAENEVIGNRSYGKSPEVVEKMGRKAFFALNEEKLIGCAKHFPGHGMTKADSHKELPITPISKEELEKVHIAPYRTLIAEKKIDMIMTAHVLYPAWDALPATFSKKILDSFLRKSLKFEGILITDDLEMLALDNYLKKEGIISQKATLDELMQASVRLSFEAGNDMMLICNNEEAIVSGLNAAYAMQNELLPIITHSTSRIEAVKDRFGLRL